jgi:hypothetical protein
MQRAAALIAGTGTAFTVFAVFSRAFEAFPVKPIDTKSFAGEIAETLAAFTARHRKELLRAD